MAGKKQPYFVDSKKQKDISKRIYYLRTKKHMTQTEFAGVISSYMGKKPALRYSTISNWENGHPPRQKILSCIAEFFQVPPETFYLTEDESFPENSTHLIKVVGSKDKEDLIYRKLAQFNGQPVWCTLDEGMGLGATGKWGIVCLEYKAIVFSVVNTMPFSKINFPIYKHPIQFEYAFEACGDSLTADEVRKYKKVWLEPLGGDYALRQRMKGFGRYYLSSDCVMIDSDKSAYPMSSYGKTFVCFKEEPKYTKETPLFEPTEEVIRKSAVEKVRMMKTL